MRSSPAFAGLALELPVVTLADRVACGLLPTAGAFGASVLLRHDLPLPAVAAVVAGLGLAAIQVRNWTRSKARPTLLLEQLPDGSLQVTVPGAAPVPATLGRRTRRLGPSVFLEVHFASGGRRRRYARWLTRFDVPRGALRRWTVVLPTCGRVLARDGRPVTLA